MFLSIYLETQLDYKTEKNVQIDPQTKEIWPIELFVTLSMRE